MVKHLFPLLLLAGPALAFTENEASGKFWTNHLRSMNYPLEDYTEHNSGLFLAGSAKPSENTSAKAELLAYHIRTPFLDAPEEDLEDGELFTEINELSLSYFKEGLTIKGGQQVTSWGKSDGLNPTDFLSGRRNLLLVPDDQLTRRGHGSVMAEWLPDGGSSPWSFQQWVVPLHSTTDVLLNKELTQDLVELERVERAPRVEIAAKISYAGQGWDLDYTYFNGVSKAPIFTESSTQLAPFQLKIAPNYVHQEGHGLNFSLDLEWSVVRLEAAYLNRREVLERGDFIKDPSRIDVVAGLEKSIFDEHRFNFQGVVHHYPSYEEAGAPDAVTAQVQNVNKILLAQHVQTRLGYLLVYNFEPSAYNQLKIKFNLLNYFYDEYSLFFFPQIDYLVTDNLKLHTYAMIFEGGDETPFGVLEQLSSIAFGAGYQF